MIPMINKKQIEQTKTIFKELAETKEEVKKALPAIELTLATIEDKDVMTVGLVTMALFRSLPLITMNRCMESFQGFMKTRAIEELKEDLQNPELRPKIIEMFESALKNKFNNENKDNK